ncbi:probable cytochrome P450 49a1 isoform X2 [Penaeus indicus]
MQRSSNMRHLLRNPSFLQPLLRPHLRGAASRAAALASPKGPEAEEERPPLPFEAVPGPRRWPLLGSLPAMLAHPAFDFERLPRLWSSYFKEFGPTFRLRLPGQGDIVYLSQPKDIECLMRATQENPIRPFLLSLKKVRQQTAFFKKDQTGIITEHGEEWWRVRRLIQTYSMRPKIVVQYLPQMDLVAKEFVERIAKLRDGENELPENFVQELFKWSLESVCLVTLNRRMGCLEGRPEGLKIIETSSKMFEAVTDCEYGVHWWKFIPTPSYRNLKASHDIMLGLAIEAVQHAQETLVTRGDSEGELNLVESLIGTPGLSFEDVVTHIIDFFLAATDTTSMTFIFTLYNLARHPHAQAKLQEELDEVLGRDHTAPVTPQQLARLSYTKACVRETLRVFAVAGFVARELHKDLVLDGYHVPKGTYIFASQFESGQNEEAFPNPDQFTPERWLRGNRGEEGSGQSAGVGVGVGAGVGVKNQFASIPFSVGPRKCIGSRIAQQEVYVLLARLLQRYNVSYHHTPWDPVFKTLLFPDQPPKFTVTER